MLLLCKPKTMCANMTVTSRYCVSVTAAFEPHVVLQSDVSTLSLSTSAPRDMLPSELVEAHRNGLRSLGEATAYRLQLASSKHVTLVGEKQPADTTMLHVRTQTCLTGSIHPCMPSCTLSETF